MGWRCLLLCSMAISRGADAMVRRRWDVLGPFPCGKTELDGIPTEFAADRLFTSLRPDDEPAPLFPSELASGGVVGWKRFEASDDGRVTVHWPDVAWSQMVQALSSVQVLEFQAVMLSAITARRAGLHRLHCSHAHTLYVEPSGVDPSRRTSLPLVAHGDVYGGATTQLSLWLDKGETRKLVIRLRGRGQASVQCSCVRIAGDRVGASPLVARAPQVLVPVPAQLPDLHVTPTPTDGGGDGGDGATLCCGGVGAISVTNAALTWLDDVIVAAAGATTGEPLVDLLPIDRERERGPSLAPGQTLPIRFRMRLTAAGAAVAAAAARACARGSGDCDRCVTFAVRVRAVSAVRGASTAATTNRTAAAATRTEEQEQRRHELELPVTLRCRHARQSFLLTFVDHDGTVSTAAAIRPHGEPRLCRAPASAAGCATVLSFSGVGTTPESHADAHKYVPPSRGGGGGGSGGGAFVFGLRDAWVLVPERQGAHNWEGVGIQTARAALEALHAASRELGLPADTARVAVLGHSRGGHGALTFATRAPDVVCGVIALSGWINREEYADANTLMKHDVSRSFLDPALHGLLESTVIEHDVGMSLANLASLPVLLRTASSHSTKAPMRRRLARLLDEAGARVSLRVVAGQRHWWWDTKTTNDGGALFDDEIRGFLRDVLDASSSSRNGSGGSVGALAPAAVRRFRVKAPHPGTFDGRGGVCVTQLTSPGRHGSVEVRIVASSSPSSPDAALCELTTHGVRRLSVAVVSSADDRFDRFGCGRAATVRIDGVEFSRSEIDNAVRVADDATTAFGLVVGVAGDATEAVATVAMGGATGELEGARESRVPSSLGGAWWRWELSHPTDPFRFTRDRAADGAAGAAAGERGPRTYGPARQVFMSPVLVVIEDEDVRRLTASGDEERSEERAEDMAEEEAARGSRSIALEAATFVATSHFEAVGSHVEMCALSDLSSRIVRGHNLVLVGDVAFQDRARRYISRELNHSVPSTASGGGDSGPPGPPVRLHARRRSESTSVLQVGPCRFAAPGVGLVFTSPRYEPDGSARIDLVVTATDDVGLLEATSFRYSFSSNTPLTRGIYTNMWPDFTVLTPRVAVEGVGGIGAAGRWGNRWEWRDDLAWAQC